MEKAYDKLDWNFVTCVLRKFGFRDQWIAWINELIRDNPISLLIKGASTAFFKSGCGLRQGDPLSPSLFIIAEVLSRGNSQLLKTNKIRPFYVHKQAPKNLTCPFHWRYCNIHECRKRVYNQSLQISGGIWKLVRSEGQRLTIEFLYLTKDVRDQTGKNREHY